MATATKSKKNKYAASNQWATRPADERFWNLGEMYDALNKVKEESREYEVPLSQLHLVEKYNSDSSYPDIGIEYNDSVTSFNHWSFGQFSSLAGAPASYLRTLPAELVIKNLNHGLNNRGNDNPMQLMIRQHESNGLELRSVTTKLTRLWNAEKVKSLMQLSERGWMTPPARPAPGSLDPRCRPATIDDIVPGQDGFGLSVRVGDMIGPAGLYAGDEDMFVFQIHPQRFIEEDGSDFMRGYFLSNSEVGGGSLVLEAFLLENVCGNHIVWGATDVFKIRKSHKGKDILQMDFGMMQRLKSYANESTQQERQIIHKSKGIILGSKKEEVVVEILGKSRQLGHGLTETQLNNGYDIAVEREDTAKAPPTSLWGMVHALTRLSQQKANAGDRNDIDTGAGKLLKLASGK